jgi:adenylate kinase family enzyme
MSAMRRILVIGSSGAGKSTIARDLGDIMGIEVHHFDKVMWKPGCRLSEPEDEPARQAPLLEQPEWIIDGNYTASLPERLKRADTVVLVDYPRELCLFRAARRLLRFFGRNRPDMGGGCRERLDLDFLKWIWFYPHRERPVLRKLIRAHGGHARLVRLRFPHQAQRWLAQLRGVGHPRRAKQPDHRLASIAALTTGAPA